MSALFASPQRFMYSSQFEDVEKVKQFVISLSRVRIIDVRGWRHAVPPVSVFELEAADPYACTLYISWRSVSNRTTYE